MSGGGFLASLAQTASDAAVTLAPILGLIWLVVQITTKVSAIDGLFDKFAELMAETLDQAKAVVDKGTGDIVRVTPDAATLNVVRQFLKDTVTALQPGTHNPVVYKLASNLPFNGEEHEDEHYH